MSHVVPVLPPDSTSTCVGYENADTETVANRALIYTEEPKEALKWNNEVWRLVADGTLKFRVHQYPFTADGVKQSQLDMTSGRSVGKLLIKVT